MMRTRGPSADSPALHTTRFNMRAVVATRSRAGADVDASCCADACERGARRVAMKASANRAAAGVALFIMAVRAMDCRRRGVPIFRFRLVNWMHARDDAPRVCSVTFCGSLLDEHPPQKVSSDFRPRRFFTTDLQTRL